MKKILYTLYILFVLYLCSSPIHSKASSFVVSPDTLLSISNGFNSLEYGGLLQNGIVPVDMPLSVNNYKDVLNQIAGKNTYTSINSSDIIVFDSIPSDVYDELLNFDFRDSNGNQLGILDIKYATFDNGYYSGSCFIDQSGDIVYKFDVDQSSLRQCCDVKFGGSIVSEQEWDRIYDDTAASVKNQGFNYSLTGNSDNFGSSYYLAFGRYWGNYPRTCGSLFISNQYIPGVVVPSASSNGDYINTWYSNDLSVFHVNSILGSVSISYSTGNYSYDGNTYSYLVQFVPGLNFSGVTPNYQLSEFLNLGTGQGDITACLGNIGTSYNSALINDSIPFIPSKGFGLSLSDVYNLEDVIEGVGSWSDVAPSPNYDYDNELPISVSNYPISIVGDDDIVSDPSIPIAQSTSIVYDPALTQEVELVPNGGTGLQIPFLENILNRYPFCIPRDISYFVGSMRRTPTAPAWNFDYTFHFLDHDFTYHFEGDLSDFDDLARIFRSLLLISFIIALCIFSYDHHF